MIKTKKDLKFYIFNDFKANDYKKSNFKPFNIKFILSLRKYEYSLNKKRKNLIFYLRKLRYIRLCNKYNLYIYPNSCGYGLKICHQNIVLNSSVVVGNYCSFHGNNCVGNSKEKGTAPRIGNNVEFGYGCVVIGNISIGDNVLIGANSTITKNISDNTVVVGINKTLF